MSRAGGKWKEGVKGWENGDDRVGSICKLGSQAQRFVNAYSDMSLSQRSTVVREKDADDLIGVCSLPHLAKRSESGRCWGSEGRC